MKEVQAPRYLINLMTAQCAVETHRWRKASSRRWYLNSDEYKYAGGKRIRGPSKQHEQRPGGMKRHAMFKLLAQTSFLKKIKLMQFHRTWGKKSQDLNNIRWWEKSFNFKQKMQLHKYGSFKLLVIKSIYSNKYHLGFAGVSKL